MNKMYRVLLFGAVGILCCADPVCSSLTDQNSGSKQPPSSAMVSNPADREDLYQASLNQKIPEWLARWELARVLSYVQRYNESIDQYKKVLKEKPDLTQAKLEMAKVMAWAGRREEAQSILESFPGDDLDPEARLELADIYAAQKEYRKSVSIYESYLREHPKQDRIRLKLAQTLSWAGEYEESLAMYEALVDKHPQDIQLRRQYAQVLTWAERYDQAIDQYQKTLQD